MNDNSEKWQFEILEHYFFYYKNNNIYKRYNVGTNKISIIPKK